MTILALLLEKSDDILKIDGNIILSMEEKVIF